ncbi:MAG: gamma-glutamyl-gamma-aminobutyrate hydrolase family protein [Bacteroidetes bacterium]|nr:gamma-glutamyl-gamma-aminobutyrate hydrolase family protein [Bacteroidota bacterium]MDA1336207.1 gamma-glutamyl-gamma-aminobutyrate hydrolase family protein [Bacteroidota bacterium]
MVRILIVLACASLLCGCSNSYQDKSNSPHPDTLHIVASRLFESQTYEDFLEPLAAPDVIQWHDASELTDAELASALEEAQGVLMTGGADIHPARYSQAADTTSCGAIDLERDRIESAMLHAVDSLRLPCLGICRGLQFMNVHNGGTLHAHLPDVLGTDVHRAGTEGNSRDTLHTVITESNAGFIGIEQESTSQVISHHHQGINQLGTGLEAWAYAPDGLIEGIRRADTMEFPFYVGVQWHPERSPKAQPLVEPVGIHFIHALRMK